ncbi:MAG: NifB/NifX family molybdenum-iron cluster-binding protein [Actinomycetes bacterium]
MNSFVACATLLPDGSIGGGWGKANTVAIAEIVEGKVAAWRVEEVGWRALHDTGTEGSHHARIVRFLNDNKVTVVATGHMGDGMQNTLGKMGVKVHLDVSGEAKSALEALARG